MYAIGYYRGDVQPEDHTMWSNNVYTVTAVLALQSLAKEHEDDGNEVEWDGEQRFKVGEFTYYIFRVSITEA